MPWKNLDRKREYQRRWIAARRAAFLLDKCCVWCYSTEDLQIDHILIGTKSFEIKWSYSWAKLKPELDKCQILCKPCHEAKTNQHDYPYYSLEIRKKMGHYRGLVEDGKSDYEIMQIALGYGDISYGPWQLPQIPPKSGQHPLWAALIEEETKPSKPTEMQSA